MFKTILTIASILLAFTLFAAKPEGQWPMNGLDVHGSHSKKDVVFGSGEVLWSADVPKYGFSAPVLDKDGNIYIFGHSSDEPYDGDYAIKIDPEGNIKWSVKTPEGPSFDATPIVVDDGFIYAMGGYGQFYKFSIEDGAATHVADIDPGSNMLDLGSTGEEVKNWFAATHPIMDEDGNIFIISTPFTTGGSVHLFSLKTDGTIKWDKIVAENSTNLSPVMHTSGKILLYDHIVDPQNGTLMGRVLEVNKETGEFEDLFTPTVGPLFYDAPVVDVETGITYIVGVTTAANSELGYTAAFNKELTELEWQSMENGVTSHIQPGIGPNNLYAISHDEYADMPDTFSAVDKKTGELLWRKEISSAMDKNAATPITDKCGNVIVAYNNGDASKKAFVKGFRPDGEEIFNLENMEGGLILATPAVADNGTIYVKAGTKLYAIGGTEVDCTVSETPDDDTITPDEAVIDEEIDDSDSTDSDDPETKTDEASVDTIITTDSDSITGKDDGCSCSVIW